MRRLAIITAMLLAGCSSVTQRDQYMNAAFELCNIEVKVYAQSDDGRTRIICKDGSKFALRKPDTLEYMRDINMDYCLGGGLGFFTESDRYVMFKCKSGELISLNK